MSAEDPDEPELPFAPAPFDGDRTAWADWFAMSGTEDDGGGGGGGGEADNGGFCAWTCRCVVEALGTLVGGGGGGDDVDVDVDTNTDDGESRVETLALCKESVTGGRELSLVVVS